MTIAPERPQTVNTLHELNGQGDTKITWNPGNVAEVETAREHFDRLRGMGHLAYAIDPADQSAGEQLREFDPAARQIVMAPQLQGG